MEFKGVSLTHVLPCLADAAKIRAIVEFDGEISAVMPYLNAEMRNCVYNHEALILTYIEDGEMVTIYPNRMTIAKALDSDDALRFAEKFRQTALEIWSRRESITPCTERRRRLSAVDIVRLLPLTNCGKCGAPTCLVMAVEIAAEKKALNACPPLFTPEFAEKRKLLARILFEAGYQVPEVFR